jgi:hypothetical protein
MNPRLLFTFIIGFTAVVHASDNSDEVFFEEIPEHQPHWNFVPRAPQEVDSDSNYMQWRYKFLSGSDKRLGSEADTAAIKQLVPATIPRTIRWVSRSVVVVASDCHSDASPSRRMRCLYVFEKHGSKWKLTHHYRGAAWVGLTRRCSGNNILATTRLVNQCATKDTEINLTSTTEIISAIIITHNGHMGELSPRFIAFS